MLRSLEVAIGVGWTDRMVLGGFALAVALLAAFTLVEWKAEAPLVPFDVFTSRTLRYGNLAILFLLGTVVTVFFFTSLLSSRFWTTARWQTGLAYVPLAVVVAVGAGLASGLIAKLPGKAPRILGRSPWAPR